MSRSIPILLGLLLLAPTVRAEVFHSRDSGLRTAFPEADRFETRSLLLDEEQRQEIEAAAGSAVPSRLVRVHVAWSGNTLLGFGYLDTHKVRSLPETILVAVDPGGESHQVHLLAFHEPPEYAPPSRWLAQFQGRALDADLSLRHGIAGMAGSTLTAQSITAAVRRILAIHRTVHEDMPHAAHASTRRAATGTP